MPREKPPHTRPAGRESPAPHTRGTAGFTVFAANRIEKLVDPLAELLRSSPLGPLEREVIVVQSRGMYRWLTLELAARLGIAAGLATPFPGVFLRALMERAEGATPATASERYEPMQRSVFDPDLLTWRLFALLGSRPLGFAEAYLRDDPDQRKRQQLARRVAERFDEYMHDRPDLLSGWEDGRQPITDDAFRCAADWQAELWRTIVETAPSGDVSPVARLHTFIERLHASSFEAGRLPRRIHVFGPSSLAHLQLRAFSALARHVPVSFYVVQPTDEYWADLVSETTALHRASRAEAKGYGSDAAHDEVGHVLLASLGRQGRDFHDLLIEADEHGSAWTSLGTELPPRTTLLGNLQADIAELIDRTPSAERGGAAPGAPRRDTPPIVIEENDRSLQVHVCHSPMREMEILRDVLLDAFARDPELRPHDVFVLAPDITAYAPYVEAVFGKDRRAADSIPFTIADRSPRFEQPIVEAATRILALVGSRVAVSAVLELLDFDAVRRAAGVSADEAAALRDWLCSANVRWGIDGEHRRRVLGTSSDDVDTWRMGLDRLLMGYAVAADDAVIGGVLPLPHGAADPGLLGRGVTFLERLLEHVRRLESPRSLEEWAEGLRAMLSDLLAPDGEEERIAFRAFLSHVEDLKLGETLAAVHEPVHIAVVRAHLEHRMDSTAGGAGFLTGAVTFCTLKPLRSIPAKIICIVGLGEGSIPRLERRASFDLMRAERRRGDRSPRDDDRYLFLETLLAARQRLVLTYVGRSQKDNTELAPSILVTELLDCVDRCTVTADGSPPHGRLVVQHALQPFSPRYFGGDAGTALFSYSHENCRAARAAAAATGEPAVFCPSPLVRDESQVLDVSLRQLCDFLVHPSKYFCREVLGVRLPDNEGAAEDDEPFRLDPLAVYGITERLVRRRVTGGAATEEMEIIRAAGALPHAGFGRAELARRDAEARELAACVTRYSGPPPVTFRSCPVELEGTGWRISGLIESVTERGLIRFRPAEIKPKDRIRMWVEHLVASALRATGSDSAELPVDATLLGKDEVIRFTPVSDPLPELDRLIAIYREGLTHPVALFQAASFKFIDVLRKQDDAHGNRRSSTDPLTAARAAFEGSGWKNRGDREDPYVKLCTRDRDPLTDDVAEFIRLASALWLPYFAHANEESE